MTFQINKTGKYFNSKYSNSKLGFFGKSFKSRNINQVNVQYPGPGYYQYPSEFGQY